jgi:hypothetical protein
MEANTMTEVSEMIDATLTRLTAYAQAIPELDTALTKVLGCAEQITPHQMLSGELIGTELHALFVLLGNARARTAIEAYAKARQLGWQVATYLIAPLAKESGDESVVFITSNNYVPSLRAFGPSEHVWQLDDPGVWEAYSEAVEERCAELSVFMAEPESDNALFVVDVARFKYVGDERDCDTLTEEWVPYDPAP